MRTGCVMIICWLLMCTSLFATDWPQLQQNARRTGCTSDEVQPPYRMRWIWLGPSGTLRNTLSVSTWTGPQTGALPPHTILDTVFTIPPSVPYAISGQVQPVVARGKVFIGDVNGRVYAINTGDGSTVWTSTNAGGTLTTCAVIGTTVAFTSPAGFVRGYDTDTGALLWQADVGAAITCCPAAQDGRFYVGTHAGKVSCIAARDGAVVWTSPALGAQIGGGLALDDTAVYTGTENMYFHKLDINTGAVLASRKVSGQSFYTQWPVVASSYVFVEVSCIPCVGSEYVGEIVMSSATSFQDEQARWRHFLTTYDPSYLDASPDWKHLTVFRRDTMTEPFLVPCAPFEGCGAPPEPPCVDTTGRVLTYFKTKMGYETFTSPGAFGTNHSIDYRAIDLATGDSVVLGNFTVPASSKTNTETDNGFATTVGGRYVYWRQEFRGTKCSDLTTAKYYDIQHGEQAGDGGSWNSYLMYHASGNTLTASTGRGLSGRVGVVISDDKIFFQESCGIICMEHHQ